MADKSVSANDIGDAEAHRLIANLYSKYWQHSKQ